jgi:hypothetical protein
LVRFHVQLLAMFLLSSSFHLLLRRFHLSRFTSEILVIINTMYILLTEYLEFFFFYYAC